MRVRPFSRPQTPDIPDLPWKMDNGVKVFHLVAEPVKRQIHPDKTIDVWGYNGTSPGPTLQVMQEDRVRIIVDNHLPGSHRSALARVRDTRPVWTAFPD